MGTLSRKTRAEPHVYLLFYVDPARDALFFSPLMACNRGLFEMSRCAHRPHLHKISTDFQLKPTHFQPIREGLTHSGRQAGPSYSPNTPMRRPKTHYPRLGDGFLVTPRVELEVASSLPAGSFTRKTLILGHPSQNRPLNGGIVSAAAKRAARQAKRPYRGASRRPRSMAGAGIGRSSAGGASNSCSG